MIMNKIGWFMDIKQYEIKPIGVTYYETVLVVIQDVG